MTNSQRGMTDIQPKTIVDAARANDVAIRLLWEMPGPENTAVEWLSCYALGQGVVIVETFTNGDGWQAYTAGSSARVDDMVADVFQRCGVVRLT